jgi:hypothetical protein
MKNLPVCGSFFGVQVRQFFLYIFPHMTVQVYFHAAERTYEVGAFRQVCHRERIFPAAYRAGDSQLLLFHFGISLETAWASPGGHPRLRLQVTGFRFLSVKPETCSL